MGEQRREETQAANAYVETFRSDVARATAAVSKTCGIPIVVTIRAMGFAIVPESYVVMFEKVLAKIGAGT